MLERLIPLTIIFVLCLFIFYMLSNFYKWEAETCSAKFRGTIYQSRYVEGSGCQVNDGSGWVPDWTLRGRK